MKSGKNPESRGLVTLGATLFAVSTSIMMTAALNATDGAGIGKILDVPIAALLFMLMLRIRRLSGGQASEWAQAVSYQVSLHLPAVVFIALLPLTDRITWYIFLIGMAWRTWLLLYALPYAITVWSGRAD